MLNYSKNNVIAIKKHSMVLRKLAVHKKCFPILYVLHTIIHLSFLRCLERKPLVKMFDIISQKF